MPRTREEVGNTTIVKDDDGTVIRTIERVFENGKMIVKRDGNVVREVTVEQLERQVAAIDARAAQMKQRKAVIMSQIEQAKASA